MPDSILITDFDGTMTAHDFYALAIPRFVAGDLPDYWSLYAQGRITHFEAMRSIFSHIRGDEPAVLDVLAGVQPDPDLAPAVGMLRASGWDVEVVSAGCRWYIDRVLAWAGVTVKVHASPGRLDPVRGLVMELPEDSPFCSPELGIDKSAVVRSARERYRRVAFAGDGPPDLAPALLADPSGRFARGWLAAELRRLRRPFRSFARWSEIARALTQERREGTNPPAAG